MKTPSTSSDTPILRPFGHHRQPQSNTRFNQTLLRRSRATTCYTAEVTRLPRSPGRRSQLRSRGRPGFPIAFPVRFDSRLTGGGVRSAAAAGQRCGRKNTDPFSRIGSASPGPTQRQCNFPCWPTRPQPGISLWVKQQVCQRLPVPPQPQPQPPDFR